MFSRRKLFIVTLTLLLITMVSVSFAYVNQVPPLSDTVEITSIPPVRSTLLSNRYTQQDDLTIVDQNPYVSLDGHEYLGTYLASNLSLYVHPKNLSLRVINETTGFVWGSNMNHDYLDPDDPLYDPNNPQTNIAQDNSPVSISYYNTNQIQLVRQSEYFMDGAFSGSFNRTDYDDKVGFIARMKMPRTGIEFDLDVYLDEEGLHVKVPYESVKDNGNFLISTITIYRNFGFTVKDTMPGYVFVPDGIGALIRYDGSMTKNFSKRFYGPDLTLARPDIERYLTAGVYGTVQGINQNAMLTIVASGAANATLTYQSQNPNVIFNKLYTTFEYRDKYVQRLNQAGTSTVELVQTYKNKFDIHFIHKFLDGDDANYVGFARSYRDYLTKKGVNISSMPTMNNIPLHLDVLALENKATWFGRQTVKMTSATDIAAMVQNLNDAGIEDIYATIHGWQKGGLSQTSPNFGRIDSAFGSVGVLDLPNLNVFYATTPTLGYVGGGGYRGSDVVQNQGSELIALYNYYLLNVERGLDILESNYTKILKKDMTNLSLESMDLLYSDHDQLMSRSEAIDILQTYLNVADKTMISHPFDYLFGADVIKEIELYSSQRIDFTDTVPFLTLVLSGQKLVFGRSANFFANTQNELLRMIDYQVYPNFYMTNESAGLLQHTDSSFIFTSKFSDWQMELKRQYQYLNGALSHVMGHEIVLREVLEVGLIRNTYDNGVQIYINYSGDDYHIGGITIEGLSYEVVI